MCLESFLKSLGSLVSEHLSPRSEATTLFQLRQGILGAGCHAARNTDRWKTLLGAGESAAGANFALLGDAKPRRREFAASVVVQCLAIILLIELPALLPQRLQAPQYEVISIVAPPTKLPLRPPEIPRKTIAPAERVKFAKLSVPLRHVFGPPNFEASGPRRPRAPVKTSGFSAVRFTSATTRRDARQFQTGGFGDSYGLPGSGDPNKRANIARKGSYGMPVGPGFGNGLGGESGVPGIGAGGGSGGAPPEDAVVILSKPQPEYTREARSMRLEGEVLLQVVFRASGHVQVIGVVRGLGHGLDESAVRAAEQIRFRPARRHGTPVDTSAIIHIVFQLAY